MITLSASNYNVRRRWRGHRWDLHAGRLKRSIALLPHMFRQQLRTCTFPWRAAYSTHLTSARNTEFDAIADAEAWFYISSKGWLGGEMLQAVFKAPWRGSHLYSWRRDRTQQSFHTFTCTANLGGEAQKKRRRHRHALCRLLCRLLNDDDDQPCSSSICRYWFLFVVNWRDERALCTFAYELAVENRKEGQASSFYLLSLTFWI